MTAPKRKAISKKIRFEVFKRDGFKCQYCGAQAPDVLLVVDHIQPVSKDGDHGMMNFITACDPCNSGKSDKLLSDASTVKKQQAQLAALHARREQLEMMLAWREGLKDLDQQQLDVVTAAWEAVAIGWHLNETGLKSARIHLKRHGLQAVLDAIDVARDQYVKVGENGKATEESVTLAWKKVGGICALAALPEDERRLYYVRAILNKRLNYVPYDVLTDLQAALRAGLSADSMTTAAKRSDSWSEFRDWLYDSTR